MDAVRRVWNQGRKQANKNLKQQRVELTRLQTELSKVEIGFVFLNVTVLTLSVMQRLKQRGA
jgi:hypothetical protein